MNLELDGVGQKKKTLKPTTSYQREVIKWKCHYYETVIIDFKNKKFVSLIYGIVASNK